MQDDLRLSEHVSTARAGIIASGKRPCQGWTLGHCNRCTCTCNHQAVLGLRYFLLEVLLHLAGVAAGGALARPRAAYAAADAAANGRAAQQAHPQEHDQHRDLQPVAMRKDGSFRF